MVHYPLANNNNPFANPFDRVVVVEKPANYGTPYQVQFTTKNIGKHVSSAKREIKFRFGFASDKAIYAGLTGISCCGEEHEVKILRTMNSGKRQVLVDNKEIHSSSSRLDGKFELTWTMCGHRKAKVIVTRFPVGPKARYFDFILDGVSYFNMPKISQLGKQDDIHPAFDRPSSPHINTTVPKTTAIITKSRFSFFHKNNTIPRSRSCPAIKTYKKKKMDAPRAMSVHCDRTSTSSNSYSSSSPVSDGEGRREYNKPSGKYVITKALPAGAAMC